VQSLDGNNQDCEIASGGSLAQQAGSQEILDWQGLEIQRKPYLYSRAQILNYIYVLVQLLCCAGRKSQQDSGSMWSSAEEFESKLIGIARNALWEYLCFGKTNQNVNQNFGIISHLKLNYVYYMLSNI
jgi:hypothetical protein